MTETFIYGSYRPDNATNRVVNVKKNAEMWNAVFREHQDKHPVCNGFLSWDSTGEEKRGLVWLERAKCNRCNYLSKKFKLYEEVDPAIPCSGRKAAKTNLGVQIGLMQTPVGNSALRRVLLSANIPAPSTKGLQKSSRRVSNSIEQQNQKDMKQRRKNLLSVHKFRNSANPNAVDVEGDGIYNNKLYSGVGKTPFQPSTQVVYMLAENSTPQKQIIACTAKSKLCSKHGKHEGTCGEESSTCTANIKMTDTIGNEKRWATECLKDLKEDELEVRFITTDPDTAAYKATESFYQQGHSQTEPENLIDTRHLSENVRKKLKNDVQLIDMMPAGTKAEQEKLCARFAIDLSFRCTAEVNQAHQRYPGDFEMLKTHLSYTVDAVVSCYMGSHELCKKHSFVCQGGSEHWLERSSVLPPDFSVCGSTDRETERKLRECVNLRLGPSVLNKTKLNTNTQKVESANQAMRRAMPSHTTFPAVFTGRCHSAIHATNYGSAESLARLCDGAGCSIAPGSSVAKALQAEQKIYNQRKAFNRSERNILAKARKRQELFDLYEDLRENDQYEKGMLLKSEKGQKQPKKCEHCYSKKPKYA